MEHNTFGYVKPHLPSIRLGKNSVNVSLEDIVAFKRLTILYATQSLVNSLIEEEIYQCNYGAQNCPLGDTRFIM